MASQNEAALSGELRKRFGMETYNVKNSIL